jgi:hypothetical protein
MRHVLSVSLSLIGLAAIAVSGPFAHARTRAGVVASPTAIQDRFCLQGKEWGYPGNCAFATYEQCWASASGTDAGCGENPDYLFAEQRRGYWPTR